MAKEDNIEERFFERQLVIFNLGNEEYGVDISDVREITKLQEITKIPDTPPYVKGIINLRGKIVVIFDLALKLGLENTSTEDNMRILVTDLGDISVGFIVDTCNEVLRLTGDKIEAAHRYISQKINADYLQGVGLVDERVIIIVDLGKVIGTTDLSNIVPDELSKSSTSSEKKTVMIVEDSTVMRGTLRSYIDSSHFNILEAGDGEEAMMVFEENHPEIVLLDIKLPKKNGIDVLKEIKAKSPETKIVMQTSVYEDETKKQCLELGAVQYLKKPINKKQIVDVLKSL